MRNNKVNYNDLINYAVNEITFEKGEIESVLKKWDTSKCYYMPDRILKDVFSDFQNTESHNQELEYQRVSLLNQIYSTNLNNIEILKISNYILSNRELRKDLEAGSVDAVHKISKSLADEGGRYIYVFATKFCYFAAPDNRKEEYPIFDNLVSHVYKKRRDIWESSTEGEILDFYLSSWDKAYLNNETRYPEYKKAVLLMQDAIFRKTGLELTIKQLDQYLWLKMKLNIDNCKREMKR